MTRNVSGWALGLSVAFTVVISPTARGGDDAADSRGNVPRDQERATVAARKTKAAPIQSPVISDPEAYERELQAAKDQRDKELKEAAKETDRRRFEKRKEEIFARYAAIVAEMRNKYQAAQADAGALPPPQKQAKNTKPPAPRTGARADTSRPAGPDRNTKPVSRTTRRDDDAKPQRPARDEAALADAQKKLDEEVARHADRLEELNQQLQDAQASNNAREIRKAERAIEKESTTYEAKRAILERRVRELGGGSDGGKTAGKSRR